jgi:Ubiquitin carboxyl-terminal hydrolase
VQSSNTFSKATDALNKVLKRLSSAEPTGQNSKGKKRVQGSRLALKQLTPVLNPSPSSRGGSPAAASVLSSTTSSNKSSQVLAAWPHGAMRTQSDLENMSTSPRSFTSPAVSSSGPLQSTTDEQLANASGPAAAAPPDYSGRLSAWADICSSLPAHPGQVGMTNLGATCFCAAVVQLLCRCPQFLVILLTPKSWKHPALNYLVQLVWKILRNEVVTGQWARDLFQAVCPARSCCSLLTSYAHTCSAWSVLPCRFPSVPVPSAADNWAVVQLDDANASSTATNGWMKALDASSPLHVDATELLVTLLTAMTEGSAHTQQHSGGGSSDVASASIDGLCGVRTRCMARCGKCGLVAQTIAPEETALVMTLLPDISGAPISLLQAVANKLHPRWTTPTRCRSCGVLCENECWEEVLKVPDGIWLFHIVRNLDHRQVSRGAIDAPEVLEAADLAPLLAPGAQVPADGHFKKMATIVHGGGVNCGHYWLVGRSLADGALYEYNDSKVTRTKGTGIASKESLVAYEWQAN